MFESLFRALLGEQQKQALPQQIARHVARVSLWELSGVEALHPDVRDKAKQLIAVMEKKGRPVLLVEGYRSAKRQDTLYNQKPPVTKAKGLQSYHQYGLAFDLIFKEGGYNAPEAWWQDLGKEGRKLGLEWGGDFMNFPDRPHFEYKLGLSFTWSDLLPYFS